MPDPYTVRDGYACADAEWLVYGSLPVRRMHPNDAPPLALMTGVPVAPCLVVTGDLDAARRRLAPPDDAAIERAARAMRAWDADLSAQPWDALPIGMRKAWLDLARAAIAAAEETEAAP